MLKRFFGSSLLLERLYRSYWWSQLYSGFSGQIGGIAVSLTAAMTLHATPGQIGMMAAMGNLPYVLFLLPSGVWLDRMRMVSVCLAGELVLAGSILLALLALLMDRLVIEYLYGLAFLGGCVSVFGGTAAQVVLTQIVRRDQLVEAHGMARVASTVAEIVGPGIAGLLIKGAGVPLTLLVDGLMRMASFVALRRLPVLDGTARDPTARFWPLFRTGVMFVVQDRLLLTMALSVGIWQIFQTCAMVTQVLFATRELGLDPFEFGLCMTLAGVGTVVTASLGHRFAQCVGSGVALVVGMVVSGFGWLQLAVVPSGWPGIVSFVLMLLCYSTSVVLIFSNMLALRQAITPAPMLARMTSTMRWMTLFPALPGSLFGGLLAETYGLRFPLMLGGAGALVLALLVWRFTKIPAARIELVG